MKRPAHVLSVVGHLGYGGDENRLLSILQSVDQSRFRFTVLVMPTGAGLDATCGSLESEIEATGVRVHHLDATSAPGWLPRPVQAAIRMIRRIGAVVRLIRKWDVDLVDARLDAGTHGVVASAISRIPAVSTHYHAKPPKLFPFWWLLRTTSLNLADAVVTDSRMRRDELGRMIWNRSTTSHCIPNGIPAPVPRRPVSEVRAALGVPDDPDIRIIAQISRLVPFKGHAVLLDAARLVIDADPRAFFLFVGYGRGGNEYEQQLHEKAVGLGIADRVRIAGYPGAIGDVWQLVDIHVHASLFDSLPNAILEGMSLAKPAVVTDVGGVTEAVENEKTGLVVPPNDPAALARGLLRLLGDPALAAAFGRAARARYETTYQPAVMTRAIEACFESVLRGSPARGRKIASKAVAT